MSEFSKKIDGVATSPAANDLYVNESCDKSLAGNQKEEFHSTTQKLLYEAKCARPDKDTAVSYICTQVTGSTTRDWLKLKRVLKWLKCTLHDTRIMGMEKSGTLMKWIDASYGVHMDYRGQMRGMISMGHRIVNEKFTIPKKIERKEFD